jgi:hypothetical protein
LNTNSEWADACSLWVTNQLKEVCWYVACAECIGSRTEPIQAPTCKVIYWWTRKA